MMNILLAVLLAQSFFGGLPVDGIHCDQMEGSVEHIHSHLQIADHGRNIEVPAGIGISQVAQCLYWVHTHTPDGFIHIESPLVRPFTLGQFFDIWGENLSWSQAASVKAAAGKRLAIWVNGKPWSGSNPRSIVLRDQQTIVIQNGSPYAKPQHVDWSKV